MSLSQELSTIQTARKATMAHLLLYAFVRICDAEEKTTMDDEFSDLQKEVRKINKTSTLALECAAYVLRRALELPLDQRKGMIERLKHLLSAPHIRK